MKSTRTFIIEKKNVESYTKDLTNASLLFEISEASSQEKYVTVTSDTFEEMKTLENVNNKWSMAVKYVWGTNRNGVQIF